MKALDEYMQALEIDPENEVALKAIGNMDNDRPLASLRLGPTAETREFHEGARRHDHRGRAHVETRPLPGPRPPPGCGTAGCFAFPSATGCGSTFR